MIAAPNSRSAARSMTQPDTPGPTAEAAAGRPYGQTRLGGSVEPDPADTIARDRCSQPSMCTRWVGRHPVASVAVAAGVGMFAGWLVKRKLFGS